MTQNPSAEEDARRAMIEFSKSVFKDGDEEDERLVFFFFLWSSETFFCGSFFSVLGFVLKSSSG